MNTRQLKIQGGMAGVKMAGHLLKSNKILSTACSTEVKIKSYKIKNKHAMFVSIYRPCSAQRLALLCRSKSKSRDTF